MSSKEKLSAIWDWCKVGCIQCFRHACVLMHVHNNVWARGMWYCIVVCFGGNRFHGWFLYLHLLCVNRQTPNLSVWLCRNVSLHFTSPTHKPHNVFLTCAALNVSCNLSTFNVWFRNLLPSSSWITFAKLQWINFIAISLFIECQVHVFDKILWKIIGLEYWFASYRRSATCGGSRISRWLPTATYYLTIFSRKLHEN